jgi:hypothetical protein
MVGAAVVASTVAAVVDAGNTGNLQYRKARLLRQRAFCFGADDGLKPASSFLRRDRAPLRIPASPPAANVR